MAGLGFKDFQVGEVLTSSDVDGYLMQQAVMRFADAGARGSALGTAPGTAVALAEGMLSYVDDIAGRGAPQFYDGTSWRAVSNIVQILQTTKTDTFTSSSTSFVTVTGLSQAITPLFADSKILVIAQITHGLNDTADYGYFKVTRGGTDIYVGDAAGSRVRTVFGGQLNGPLVSNMLSEMVVYLDSPATTSSVTYQVEARRSGVGGGNIFVNRCADDSDSAGRGRGASSMTVIEVAA